MQELGVQPVAGEGLAGRGLALRDLVLVVGKDIVDAAGMDVEALTQAPHAHRRTLDVPAGAPRPQRRSPRLLAWFAGLPKDEITGIAFAIVANVDPLPALEASDITLR